MAQYFNKMVFKRSQLDDLKVNFLLREISCGNLNEVISLVEIVSFRFLWKISISRKWTLTQEDLEVELFKLNNLNKR